MTEEGGAAFTTLPVPPELAGAGVGDFAMEDIVAPAQMEEKEDDSAAAASDACVVRERGRTRTQNSWGSAATQ